MAEAIVNHRHASEWKAYSAGTRPAGYVHPLAQQVLEEIGIHHDGVSKHVSEFQGMAFDLVVTVCDSAAEECPVWLGKGARRHHSFPDPAKVMGTPEVVIAAFRAVRDSLLEQMDKILNGAAPGGI